MFDDSNILLQHVRSCFIQGDESGQCEQALDDTTRYTYSPPVTLSDADDPREGFGDRFSAVKHCTLTKTYYISALPNVSLDGLFSDEGEESDIFENKTQCNSHALSDLLSLHFSNPFHKYSRFSAKLLENDTSRIAICPNVKVFTITVFLTGRDPAESCQMTVYANTANAKIGDLIGLILWQYIVEKREPPLADYDIDHYALLSADDYDVDFGIPSFDPLEPLSKYGFTSMALVNVSSVFDTTPSRSTRVLPTRLLVTMHHFTYGTHEFSLESKDITLLELIEMYMKRVTEDKAFSSEISYSLDKNNFTLEAETEPGQLLDKLDTTTLGRVACYSFIVHRKHCNLVVDDADFHQSSVSTEVETKGHVFNVGIERSKGRLLEVELVVDADVVHLNQKEPGTSKTTPASILKATIESCKLIGTDVSAVHGSNQSVRVQLTYKPNDHTIKNLRMRVHEQLDAIEIVRLLRK